MVGWLIEYHTHGYDMWSAVNVRTSPLGIHVETGRIGKMARRLGGGRFEA